MGDNVHCQVLDHLGYVEGLGSARRGGPFFLNGPHPFIDTSIDFILDMVDVFPAILRQQLVRVFRRSF